MTADELRVWRQKHGLSLQALGELMGIPPNTLWRWETGSLRIQHPQVLYLALAALDRMLLPQGVPLPPEAD